MILSDMNQSWKPPIGCQATQVHASGAFLVVEYEHPGVAVIEHVTVYVNDQGREVMRTHWTEEIPKPIENSKPTKPLSLWDRIYLRISDLVLGRE